MNWLNRAEARFGHLAIHGLGRILVGFNFLVYILFKIYPQTFALLRLEPALVMQGEVWRLVTFIFIPGFGGIYGEFAGLLLYLLYLLFIATGLEQAIGAFKLNIYYVTGMVTVMISSMLFGGADYGPYILNATLLFGFARYFPDTVIRLFFILPVKIVWLAWAQAAFLIMRFFVKDFFGGGFSLEHGGGFFISSPEAQGWSYRITLIVCLANYFLFFGRAHYEEAKLRSEVRERSHRFKRDMREAQEAHLHECSVCGLTEAKDPYMDFRVARDGKEYCARHLPKAAPEIA